MSAADSAGGRGRWRARAPLVAVHADMLLAEDHGPSVKARLPSVAANLWSVSLLGRRRRGAAWLGRLRHWLWVGRVCVCAGGWRSLSPSHGQRRPTSPPQKNTKRIKKVHHFYRSPALPVSHKLHIGGRLARPTCFAVRQTEAKTEAKPRQRSGQRAGIAGERPASGRCARRHAPRPVAAERTLGVPEATCPKDAAGWMVQTARRRVAWAIFRAIRPSVPSADVVFRSKNLAGATATNGGVTA